MKILTNYEEIRTKKIVELIKKQHGVSPKQPNPKFVAAIGIILFILDLVAYFFSYYFVVFLFITIFLLIFCVSIYLIFTQKWLVTPTEITIKNGLRTEKYDIKDILKIYIAKIPIDNRATKTAEVMNEIISGVSVAKGSYLPVYSAQDISKLAKYYAPNQIWIDVKVENKLKSICIGEITQENIRSDLWNQRTNFIKQLIKIMPKQKIDKKIQTLFRN